MDHDVVLTPQSWIRIIEWYYLCPVLSVDRRNKKFCMPLSELFVVMFMCSVTST